MQDANERNQNQALYVLIANILIQKNEIKSAELYEGTSNYFTIRILNLIFEFVTSKEPDNFHHLQPRLFQKLPGSPAYLIEQRRYLNEKLRYLVAVEGENNQNKAKALLLNHRELAPYLISNRGEMVDAAGRCFLDRSIYGYLYWCGDTEFRNMLEEFTDKVTVNTLYLECDHIEQIGLEFKLDEKITDKSKHFSMEAVIKAAFEYDSFVLELIHTENQSETSKNHAKSLWLSLSRELGKVPLWIAQSFCSPLSFDATTSLNDLLIQRTIIFHNLLTGHSDAWFINKKPNPLLGVSIGIHRVDGDRAWGLAIPPTDALKRGLSDLKMLVQMYKVQIRKDPKQTLKKLQSAVSHEVEMPLTLVI